MKKRATASKRPPLRQCVNLIQQQLYRKGQYRNAQDLMMFAGSYDFLQQENQRLRKAAEVTPAPASAAGTYSWADLLAFAQALTPEQLQQNVWGWNWERSFDQFTPRVLKEEYVLDGDNYCPISDLDQEDLEGLDMSNNLPVGTVLFDVSE